MTPEKAIGERLKKARGSMSQSELARQMSSRGFAFHQQIIQRIESGQRPLRLSEATACAGVLGCAVSYLAGVDESDDSVALVRAKAQLAEIARIAIHSNENHG